MQRQLSPLPVTVPMSSSRGVSYLRYIPQIDHAHAEYLSVLMATEDGVVQICNLAATQSAAEDARSAQQQQVLYAPLNDIKETVTSAAVSISGQFLAVGTSSGTVGQYILPKESRPTVSSYSGRRHSLEVFRVNEVRKYISVTTTYTIV